MSGNATHSRISPLDAVRERPRPCAAEHVHEDARRLDAGLDRRQNARDDEGGEDHGEHSAH